jgi:hypothetical protein
MSGMERVEAGTNFFKNIRIMAGLFLLYLTGARKILVGQQD